MKSNISFLLGMLTGTGITSMVNLLMLIEPSDKEFRVKYLDGHGVAVVKLSNKYAQGDTMLYEGHLCIVRK